MAKGHKRDNLNKAQLAACHDEWMRRFIQEPQRYEAEFQTITKFQRDEAEGRPPEYGEVCSQYLFQIADELGV